MSQHAAVDRRREGLHVMRACPPNPVPGITAKAAWVMYVLTNPYDVEMGCENHNRVTQPCAFLSALQSIHPVAALSVDILEDEATEAAAFYGILKPSLDPASRRHHTNIRYGSPCLSQSLPRAPCRFMKRSP